MKTVSNSGDFTGSYIRISNSGGASKRMGNPNSAFEKADSQSSVSDFEKLYRNCFKNFRIFHHHLRLTEQFTE
jgi:hypothetical protein